MVKLLAVDLDGTLVKRGGEVDERDLAAIVRARAAGIVVTIATGRLYAGTRAIAQMLELDFPVVCVDGAQLVDPVNEAELDHQGIAGLAAEQLRETLLSRPVCAFLLYRDGVLHDHRGTPLRKYVGSWSPHLDEVADLYEHPCWTSERGLSAGVVIGPSADVRDAAEQLRDGGFIDVFDFRVSRAPSGAPVEGVHALIAHAVGVSKGAGLLRLATRRGCQRDELAAVGDWHNDVTMFAAAGRSFVMSHAPRSVRAAAGHVLDADSIRGGGVAEAIDLLLA